MRGFSKAIITGNLTRDPELRSTTNGTSVCSFSVAVNRVYRDSSGEQREEVSFFDCSAWGKLGETINQYAKKGSGVLVSGRLTQRSWDDKTTGAKRSRVEIVVEDFNFIGGRADSDNTSYPKADTSATGSTSSSKGTPETEVVPDEVPEGEIDLDDIPF